MTVASRELETSRRMNTSMIDIYNMREIRWVSTSKTEKPKVSQTHFAEFDEETRSCKPGKRYFSAEQEDVLIRHPIFRLERCEKKGPDCGKPEQSFRIDQQTPLEPERNMESLRDLTREYVEKLQTILAVRKPTADLLHSLQDQIGAQVRPELQLEVQALVMHSIMFSVRESVVKGGQSDSAPTSPSN